MRHDRWKQHVQIITLWLTHFGVQSDSNLSRQRKLPIPFEVVLGTPRFVITMCASRPTCICGQELGESRVQEGWVMPWAVRSTMKPLPPLLPFLPKSQNLLETCTTLLNPRPLQNSHQLAFGLNSSPSAPCPQRTASRAPES